MGNAKDRVGGIDGVHYAPGFTLVIKCFKHKEDHVKQSLHHITTHNSI